MAGQVGEGREGGREERGGAGRSGEEEEVRAVEVCREGLGVGWARE